MKTYAHLSELASLVGSELGDSDWLTVTQERIDLFAQATGDHQWIHVDPQRAASGPFGCTIAHGFLTLALVPELSASAMQVGDVRMSDQLRARTGCASPRRCRSTAALRGRLKLLAYEPLDGGAQLTVEVRIEREGSDKPVCIAETAVAALHLSAARPLHAGCSGPPTRGECTSAPAAYDRLHGRSRRPWESRMKVLLIDDHPLILVALKEVIQGLGQHLTVIGANSARTARETLQSEHDIDLVLLDLKLGDADGFDVLVEFRAAYPAIPVVVLSASDRSSDVIRAIDLGAMGFVPKRATNDTLFDALHMVMSGGIYVPPMHLGGAQPAAARRRPACCTGIPVRPARRSRHRDGRCRRLAQRLPACAGRSRGTRPHAAPDRGARSAPPGQAEQADRARAEPVGRDGEGPRGRGAARAQRQQPHAGGPRGRPDVAGAGRTRRLARPAAPFLITGEP